MHLLHNHHIHRDSTSIVYCVGKIRTPSLKEENHQNCALLFYALLLHKIEYALNVKRVSASVIPNSNCRLKCTFTCYFRWGLKLGTL
jgi:hypothetical protein